MYWSCSFWYVLTLSKLSFDLVFAGFLFFSQDDFFMIFRFSLIVIDYHGTVYLALILVGMHSTATKGSIKVFLFIIWRISWRIVLKNINLDFYNYRISIFKIITSELGPVISQSLMYLFLDSGESLLILFCDRKILTYLSTSCLWIYNLAGL